MNYRQALELIMRTVPRAVGGGAKEEAIIALNARRRYAAALHPWTFLLREGVGRNGGGVGTLTATVTQNSASVTFGGGTLPTDCAGWHFTLPQGNQERYRIVSRDSDTTATLDRPFEGGSETTVSCLVWDPYVTAPRDLFRWKSLRFEYGAHFADYEDGAWFDAYWPHPQSLGNGVSMVTLAEPTTSARYETGTVTLAKGSTTVTLSGGTWPTWAVDRHLQFQGETALYKIKSRTSGTVVVLDRAYGGKFAGAGISYQLDPPGCIRLEVMGPVEDQYALKFRYFCEPQELVNDADLLEGFDSYQRAVIDLAAADYMMATLPSAGPDGQAPEYVVQLKRSQEYEARGERGLQAVIGNKVAPEQFARIRLAHRM